jgi:glycerol-3-phosphate dehydrogenase
MRPRDPQRLASASYDLVIVGGGIHGLACAYEAASRGLRAALIDAGDIGGGTSFNQQKTAHGGLRALQTLSIGRARDGIRERRGLARLAPWLLRPLPFIIGTYRSATRSRLALRAAFALDEWLGRRRNDGVEPELHLPRARLLSRTTTMKLFPGIRADGLTGGAQWYDYQMVENDRLTFAFAAAADRAGADLATYVEARGATFDIRGEIVINAAGARAGELMRVLGVTRPFPLLKAMNLLTTRPAADIALAAPDPQGRMLTLVPWRGTALVGTGQFPVTTGPDGGQFGEQDVETFIGHANHAFPGLKLTRQDVTLVHRGLVPAVTRRDGGADLLMASQVLDHHAEGADGALTVIGAKYTTARGVAERVVATIARRLGKALPPSRTASTVLPYAGIADHEALAIETGRRLGIELDGRIIRHLIGRYAEGTADIVALIAAQPDRARSITASSSTIAAEVLYVIRQEGAVTLSDIVLRRTTLGAAGHPGEDALGACAQIAAAELGWDRDRVGQEIAHVEGAYHFP